MSTGISSAPSVQPAWSKGPYGENQYVNSAAISADGSRMIAATYFHNYTTRRTAALPHLAVNPALPARPFGLYCYDPSGNLQWQDTISDTEGFYWVDIAGKGEFAAAGGGDSSHGFVRAYRVKPSGSTAEVLLDAKTGSRVNMLALSADGASLAVVSDQLYLYTWNGTAYTCTDTFRPPTPAGAAKTNVVYSVALAKDGASLAAADYAGNVVFFAIAGGKLSQTRKWSMSTPSCMHAMQSTFDGALVAAAGGDGSVYLFNGQSPSPPWSSSLQSSAANTPDATPNPVYCVALTPDGKFLSAVVNNGPDGGWLYLFEITSASPPQAKFAWKLATTRNPNSTSMDDVAKRVTVALGHPDATPQQPSPGFFCLVDRESGQFTWQFETDNMNWPMFIAGSGNGIFAGGDNGQVYFFALSPTRA